MQMAQTKSRTRPKPATKEGPRCGHGDKLIELLNCGVDEMPDLDDQASWTEYRRLILAELQRINAAVAEVDHKVDRMRSDDISQLKVEVAMLQVKAGVWGGAAGLLITLAAVLLKYVGAH
jgi:hypothetical protein